MSPTECIGGIASLPAEEQKVLAEEILARAGALRVIGEGTP
jgi:hypothetical protein